MVQKPWKLIDLLNRTTQFFKDKHIENARLNAELLLASLWHKNRVDLYIEFERLLTEQEVDRYREMVRRRAAGEPLQYIVGETEFMGLTLRVNPSVLIPRPETEILVEEVLNLKSKISGDHPVIADIGTGSGCIAIALKHLWPQTSVFATDISAEALQTAVDNAAINNLTGHSQSGTTPSNHSLVFLQHDICTPWSEQLPLKVDILVSNPPYIRDDEMAQLPAEIRQFEPAIALTDESDGMRFYDRLFEITAAQENPQVGYLLVEMSGSQPQQIIERAREFHFDPIQTVNDLSGIPRVLTIKV
ncbi:MAG: peptide chain release factor N(5)-glutamine methyltransferase [Caldithrix sp.]|nr:peptide chain release factor N(5)-glutamine methyltransferase [Caldithrix sp.]